MFAQILPLSSVDIFFLIIFGPLVISLIYELSIKLHKRYKKYNKKRQLLKKLTQTEAKDDNENISHEHHKYDGFSDEETRNYAKGLGAHNLKQLRMIQHYNAPDYETAQKIVSGNFGTYQQLLDAEAKGASTETEVLFINKLKAPDLDTALKIKEFGFDSFIEYQTALSMGASNHDELKLIERMGSGSYNEALRIEALGFEDGQTYRIALSKGIRNFEGWKKYLKDRDELINNYKLLKKDLNKEFIMKELAITDINELLQFLEKYDVPILGNKILFSYDSTTTNHSDNGYSEFELNDLVKLDEDHQICKICLKPLIGKIGSCSSCLTKMHYDCISSWVLKTNSCPTCMEHIELTGILSSEQNQPSNTQIKCILCNRVINPLQVVIRCDYCFTIYHQSEFLEYAKIRGKCLKCNQLFKL